MWDFVSTRINWTHPQATLTAGGRREGGGRRSVGGVVSIVVPAVVCGTVVLAVLVLGAVAAVRWRRRQFGGGGGGKESSNVTDSTLSRCRGPAPGNVGVHMVVVSRGCQLTDSNAVSCHGLEKSARMAASGGGGSGGGPGGRQAGSEQPRRQLKSPASAADGRGEGSGGTGGGDGDEALGSSSHESAAQLGLALAQAHALMGAAASLRKAEEEAAARGSRCGAARSCDRKACNLPLLYGRPLSKPGPLYRLSQRRRSDELFFSVNEMYVVSCAQVRGRAVSADGDQRRQGGHRRGAQVAGSRYGMRAHGAQ